MPLIDELLAFPTALFTALLALASLYWTAVIVGAVGVDGADDWAHGDLHGDAHGHVDGHGHVDDHGHVHGAWPVVAEWLQIGKVPLSIIVSLLSLFGFIVSYLAMKPVASLSGLGAWIAGLGVLVAAIVVGAVLTRQVVRPLAGRIGPQPAETRAASIGRVCIIRSARVDATTGQAEVQDGGAGLIVSVRCAGENTLRRGDEALIVDLDAASGVYWVEPMRAIVDEPLAAAIDRASASAPGEPSAPVGTTVPSASAASPPRANT